MTPSDDVEVTTSLTSSRTPSTTGAATTTVATGWSTDDYQETVAFCGSIEGLDPAACPDLVNIFREGGCTVEEAYVFIGEIARVEEDPEAITELAERVDETCARRDGAGD